MKKAGTKQRKRVLYLNLTTFYNYLTHRGIVDFAAHNNWILSYQSATPGKELFELCKSFDGIICYSTNKKYLKLLNDNIDIPLVATAAGKIVPGVKHIMFDDIAIGRMAAEFLINKGFRRLVLVYSGKTTTRLSMERVKGIKETAKEYDVDFDYVSLEKFSNGLSKRKLPFGVILINDMLSHDVIFSITDNNLHIPLDVAVLGIDNNPLYCETSGIPLSSVKINAEKRGMIAAECLDKMMNGNNETMDTVYIKPEMVVERASTNVFAIPHEPTVKALQYLHSHIFEKELTVNDIVKSSGVCRRRLEITFLEYLKRSIPNEILRLRIDKAMDLLKNSNMDISEIADECGFSSHQSMSRIFQRKLKRTPSFFKTN